MKSRETLRVNESRGYPDRARRLPAILIRSELRDIPRGLSGSPRSGRQLRDTPTTSEHTTIHPRPAQPTRISSRTFSGSVYLIH